MIIRGDKVFRSLEEQVFKNQWDIQAIQEQTGMLGIKPVAQVVTVEQLPLVGSDAYNALAYGDAYAVGDDSVVDPTFKYYVKAKLLGVDGWLALGYIRGEQGPKGDTGEKGPAGTIATANATVDFGTGVPTVDLVLGGTPTNRTFTFNFHNLKGQKGDRGPAGSVDVVAPYWDSDKSYHQNDWVIYDDIIYRAIQNVPAGMALTPDYWEAIPDGLASILKVVIEKYGENTFTARDDVARADIATTNIRVAGVEEDVGQLMTDMPLVIDRVDTLESGYEELVAENKQLKFKIADLQNIVYDTVVEDAEVVYTDLDTASIPAYVEKDGSTHKVFDGAETMLTSISGRTVQVNQLYDHSAWASQTVNGVNITHFDDGHFSLNGQATGSLNVALCNVSIIAGHKYLLYRDNDEAVDAGDNNAFLQIYGGSGNYAQIKNNATFAGVIWTAVNSNENGVVRVRINEGTIYTNYWVAPKVVDLTMVYGAGNEPTAVDTVLADNPWILTTNEVILGELYSSVVSGVQINDANGVSSWTFMLPAPETLRSAGDAHDELRLVEQSDGTWNLEKVEKTRIIDLGANEIVYYRNTNPNGIVYFVTTYFTPTIKPSIEPNFTCDSLTFKRFSYSSATAYDTTIATQSNGTSVSIVPKKRYETVQEFKADYTGSYLVYELLNPVATTLMTGLTEPDIATLIELNGSVEILGNTNKAYAKPDLSTIIQIEKAVIS